MDKVQLQAWLEQRRSVRRFTGQVPERTLVEQCIAMAVQAPSSSNKQPWRFLVCDQSAVLAELARQVTETLQDLLPRLRESAAQAELERYSQNFTWFATASVLVVPIYRGNAVLSHLGQTPGARQAFERLEQESALASVAMAIQNLQLYAPALGLASCCMTGPLLAEASIKQTLGVAPSWRVAALVPMGYAAEQPATPGRKPVHQALRWIENAPSATAGTPTTTPCNHQGP